MKAFKGFDKDMKCRGFQFEEGRIYHEESAKLCEAGFHACEMPLDVFHYYQPGDRSVYREVELEDVTEERGDDSKRCGKTIKIGAALGIRGLVKAHLDFVFKKTEKADQYTSGNGSSAATSGNGSSAATSGDWSSAATSGNGSSAATSGRSSAATSGNGSSAATSGEESSAATKNKNGLAVACGKNARAMGALGSYIVVTEWDDVQENIIAVCLGKIDGETLKPNTWYTVRDGQFVEVEE